MNRTFASSLLFLFAISTSACSTPPPQLDLSLTQTSAAKKFVVVMQPPAKAPAINQIHSWQVKLASPNGQPITQAHIEVDGGMPQHGHGLPTHPQVTKELSEGTYLIEGMKFSMTGWWEIKLTIRTSEGTDKVTFNTVADKTVALQ
jgi:hypothetical protein